MATTMVESTSSLYRRKPFSFGSHGHEHFCSSTFTSLRKFLILVIILEFQRNVQHPTPNVQLAYICVRSSAFDVQRSAFAAHSTRQEGLEPPTDGFGDRY